MDRDELKEILEETFSTPQGKKVLKWLEIVCGLWSDLDYDSNDQLQRAIGKRSIILQIKKIIEGEKYGSK